MSNNIFENILNFNVDTFDNCLSDVHCPITLSLHAVNTNHIPNNVQPHADEVTDSEGAPVINMSFKWSLDKAAESKRNTSVSDLDILSCELEGVKLDPSQENIDIFCNKLCDVFIETAKKIDVCKIKSSPKSKFKQKVTTVKPWFDNECKHEREEYVMRVKNKVSRFSVTGKSTKSLSLLLIEPRVCAQNFTNFCPDALISSPNVPKILFA